MMFDIGKKDVLFKSLEHDDIERIGIDGHQAIKKITCPIVL